MRKSCDNCKYKDTHSKCGTCIEEYDAPLENWEPSIVAIEQMMQERNLKLEHIMEYIEFEDECIEKGFTFNSLIEAREKQIPKTVIEEPWEYDPRFSILICPSCGSHSGCQSSDGEALNFCNDCGQAIKWESE